MTLILENFRKRAREDKGEKRDEEKAAVHERSRLLEANGRGRKLKQKKNREKRKKMSRPFV